MREGGYLPEHSGVFISRWHHGSPSHRYGLYALQFVQEVNSVPTPDLDAFVAAIAQLVSPPTHPCSHHVQPSGRCCCPQGRFALAVELCFFSLNGGNWWTAMEPPLSTLVVHG